MDKEKKAVRLAIGILFLAALCHIQPAGAQNKPSVEYQVKAAFLFNFTRFINWPPVTLKPPDAPFVIGIIGSNPFGSYLDDIVSGEKLGTHRIVVERYSNVNEVTDCQILFINTKDTVKIKEILALTSRHSILTVSDADDFSKLGGDIRFIKQENKVKIEINLAAAKTSKLDISSKLLSVAKVKL